MRVPLAFAKYEGLGNDFVLIEAANENELSCEAASALCDRHFGIGADGVVLLLPPRVPGCDIRMRVINADGSVPEMCGNGVRCVALHVARARGLREGLIRVDTDAGLRACAVEDRQGEGFVTVDMGVVRLGGDRDVVLDGEHIAVAVADAGNPHAVLFGDFARVDVERLGPRLASHHDFPNGTNVEFAHSRSDGFDLIVWERGVGVTLACGTGACATVAVASAKGLAAQGVPIAVHLAGGRLEVTVANGGHTKMRGPARHVFSGAVDCRPGR
jgi:diaminopimelate epimerase